MTLLAAPPKTPLEDLFSPDDSVILKSWIETAKRTQPVVLIGAGFSLNAVPKSGWKDLVPPETLSRPPRCFTWSELIARLKREMREDDSTEYDFLRLAQYFLTTHSLQRLQFILQEAIPDHLISPGEAHFALTEIAWHTILTMNYDTLIERAYRSSPGQGDVNMIYRDQDLARPKLPGTACDLIHLHGILEDAGSLVLTSEDYRRYHQTHTGMLTLVRQIFTQHPVLIIGFSLDDPNFYALNGWIHDLLRDAGRPPVICFQHQKASEAKRQHWRGQGVQIVNLKIPTGKNGAPVLGEIGSQYTRALRTIALSLKPKEEQRDLLRFPTLLEEYIRHNIKGAPTPSASLAALEQLLALLPKTRSSINDRTKSWQAFSEQILQPRNAAWFPSQSSSAPKPSDNSWQLVTNQKPPIQPVQHSTSLEALLSKIPDDALAARWLLQGVTHVGPKASVIANEQVFDLVETLKLEKYRKHLSEEDWALVLFEQHKEACDNDNATRAEELELEIRTLNPSRETLEAILTARTHLIHRSTAAPASSGIKQDLKASAHYFNTRGAYALWNGDFTLGRELYETARERARAEKDPVAEWVALEGLRRVHSAEHAPSGDTELQSHLTTQTQLLRRIKELKQDPTTDRLESYFSSTILKGTNALSELLERKLTETSRRPQAASTTGVDTIDLNTALLDQEELGFPPDFCGKTAELLSVISIQQKTDQIKSIDRLLRYGFDNADRFIEPYLIETGRDADAKRKLLETTLRPGRSIGEWAAKLMCIRKLLPELHTSELSAPKDFTVQFLELISRQEKEEIQVLRGNLFQTVFVRALINDAIITHFRLARFSPDGLKWISQLIDSDNSRIRRSAVSQLHTIRWSEKAEMGELDHAVADELARVITRSLEKEKLLDPSPNTDLLQAATDGVTGLIKHAPLPHSISVLELRKTMAAVITKWLSGTARHDRPSSIYAEATYYLWTIDKEAWGDFLKKELQEEALFLLESNQPLTHLDRLSSLGQHIGLLEEQSVQQLLRKISDCLTEVTPELSDTIAYFLTSTLERGPKSLAHLVRTLLDQLHTQTPEVLFRIAGTNREALGDLAVKFTSTVDSLLADAQHLLRQPVSYPWIPKASSTTALTGREAENVKNGLWAAFYSLNRNTTSNASWIALAETLTADRNPEIAEVAISIVGISSLMSPTALTSERRLNALVRGISHPARYVCANAAFWMGYASALDSGISSSDICVKLQSDGNSIPIVFSRTFKAGRAEIDRLLERTAPIPSNPG